MDRSNLLIILADGMQAEALQPEHACRTPHLDRLAERGVRFERAYTVCPICSPARASFLTGLLPHQHGVRDLIHACDDDQNVLRTEYPHFAQQLQTVGYRTGYFGKWHVERTGDASRFGWTDSGLKSTTALNALGRGTPREESSHVDPILRGEIAGPSGYRSLLHWGVTDQPLLERAAGRTVRDAENWLRTTACADEPWCCCVSFSEPNEALVVGRDTWESYDPLAIPLPANFDDPLDRAPALYRRQQRIGRSLSEQHWRNARTCYYGRITELDALAGRLLQLLESTGQTDRTTVVFLADHGRYAGAHGFDAHNVGAFEEIYRIPLIIAGPQTARGETSTARVSIADVGATLCELGQAPSLASTASRSFHDLLSGPRDTAEWRTGFAEYHGTRFGLMQRVLWQDDWKFVFNGFDEDELYNLADDPHEMRNLAVAEEYRSNCEQLMAELWNRIASTEDRAILESHYLSLRMGCVGPDSIAGQS